MVRGPERDDGAEALAGALQDAGLTEEIRAWLRGHGEVLRLQAESLREEQAISLRHLRLRYFGDRLRIALQLIAIGFSLVLIAAAGALVWRAHEAHALVVEAFQRRPRSTGAALPARWPRASSSIG